MPRPSHDVFFLIKFGAFILAALISIYPTVTFFSWNRGLKAGVAPQIEAAERDTPAPAAVA
jgi:putative membrane protein